MLNHAVGQVRNFLFNFKKIVDVVHIVWIEVTFSLWLCILNIC
jgi:hypothetical protein